jgi:hypothetical protein
MHSRTVQRLRLVICCRAQLLGLHPIVGLLENRDDLLFVVAPYLVHREVAANPSATIFLTDPRRQRNARRYLILIPSNRFLDALRRLLSID